MKLVYPFNDDFKWFILWDSTTEKQVYTDHVFDTDIQAQNFLNIEFEKVAKTLRGY